MTVVPEDPRHKHDRRYSLLDHKHDGRYYTEEETDGLIEDAKQYADDQDDIHSAEDRAYTDAETAKRLRWAGVYQTIGQAYEKNDVVRDGEWTMVALVDTSDRPGPVPSGDLVNLLLPWTPTVQNARADVRIRNRWVMSSAGWIGNIGTVIEPENVGFPHTLVMYVDGMEQYSISWVPDTGGEAVQSIPVTIVGIGAEIVITLSVTTQGNENLYWSEEVGKFAVLPPHTSEAQGSIDEGATWTTTAYATTLDFQPGTSSPDWESMAYSGGGGGGGGGGGTGPHEHDAVYVNLTGDTMTGALVLPGDPTAALEAVPKQYVDGQITGHDHDDRYYTEAESDAQLAGKSDTTHNHDADYAPAAHVHDDRYYTESEVDTALAGKSDTGHLHDDRYYTEAEVDTALAGKSDTGHLHDDRYYTESEIDTQMAGKSDTGHLHDDRYYTETETDTKLAGKSDTTHTHAQDPPLPHTHPLADITDSGTAAALDAPAVGDATAEQVVVGDDSRLTDARPPTAHTHDDRYYTEAETDTALAGKSDTGHNHDGDYEPSGSVAAHEAAANPHPQYMTQAESDALYAPIDHQHDGVYSPINHNHDGTYAPAVHSHSEYVAKAGDTMSGALILHDHPIEDFQAATKQYADNAAGGAADHQLLINLDKDDHGQYAPIHVIDAADPDPTEHQRPGQIVVRKGVAVDEGLEFLQKQGGTMTGPLLLQGLPSSDNEAASKGYVDGLNIEWTSLEPYLQGLWVPLTAQWHPFFKVVNNVLYARGLVKTTSDATNVSGEKIITMPEGLRPVPVNGQALNGHHFGVACGQASTHFGNYIRVESGGDWDLGNSISANQWLSVDGITYRID